MYLDVQETFFWQAISFYACTNKMNALIAPMHGFYSMSTKKNASFMRGWFRYSTLNFFESDDF